MQVIPRDVYGQLQPRGYATRDKDGPTPVFCAETVDEFVEHGDDCDDGDA